MGMTKNLLIRAEEIGVGAACREHGITGEAVDAVEDMLYNAGLPRVDSIEDVEYAMRNPLGLVASDLVAVGWESDGVTWSHDEHGCGHSFYTATSVEASKVGECVNPLLPTSPF